MFYWGDTTFILIIPVFILALYAQSKVRGSYNKFKKVQCSVKTTGADVARTILQRNGVYDVDVKPVKGVLTDHYDPRVKEVHLSEEIFYGNSVSAVSIAAHEVGHALQHAQNYAPLQIRSSIVPVANIGSSAAFPLFLIGLFLRTPFLMDLGILLFAGALLFHLITLPVEFNASRRALKQLADGILVQDVELKGARTVLKAAALTYVASTLMALVQFLRLILLRGSRD